MPHGDLMKRLCEEDIAAWSDAYSCRARGREAADRIAALEAEVARLRGALEWIAEAELSEPNAGNRNDLAAVDSRTRARAALQGDKP